VAGGRESGAKPLAVLPRAVQCVRHEVVQHRVRSREWFDELRAFVRDVVPIESVEARKRVARAEQDRFPLCTLALTIGDAATSEDPVLVMETAVAARGGSYPLVLVSDNGPAYTSKRFEDFLEERGVVHLLSLPHTPRHNPWVERGHRDLKDESGLGKGVLIVDRDDAAQRILAALDRVDGHRRRATLGFRTARAVDAQMKVPYDDDDRARLRYEVRRRRDEALQRPVSGRARRVLCREAVLAVLEDMGWITRTRGGHSDTDVKHEGVS